MTFAQRQQSRAPALLRVALPQRPAWLEEMSALAAEPVACDDSLALEIAEAPGFAIVRATLPARHLDDELLRGTVGAAYARIGRLLRDRALFPWRVWNYIPEIRRPATIGANRYQVFNAGRSEGYRNWFGGALPGRVPAASAAGHSGASLVIDLLAGRAPGVAVENPRQVPAYGYSRRWGPFPPCFARAMTLPVPLPAQGAARCALVSGTASILGEDSRHPNDLDAQIDETCRNLAALADVLAGESSEAERALSRFRELRLYVVRDADADAVAAAFSDRFRGLERIEIALADLCREELLLEAEGIATLDARRPEP